MGQKVNPNSLRINVNRSWILKWEANDSYQTAQRVIEGEKIRNYFLVNYKLSQIVEKKLNEHKKRLPLMLLLDNLA